MLVFDALFFGRVWALFRKDSASSGPSHATALEMSRSLSKLLVTAGPGA